MKSSWAIVCDSAELALECNAAASALRLRVETEVEAAPVNRAIALLETDRPTAIAIADTLAPDALVTLSAASHEHAVALAIIRSDVDVSSVRFLARDLGIPSVSEVGPLMTLIALIACGAKRPYLASTRGLPSIDRNRMHAALGATDRSAGRFLRDDAGKLLFRATTGGAVQVGEARDVAEALVALRDSERARRPAMPTVEGLEPQRVLDVIFGPPRALSDPASKAALEPYDLPVPMEELCTSPSRAASEAARIGFPVRIALASPDLRVWNHEDLAVDGVDNAARVREVFRNLTTVAQARAPDARLLGVTVTATTNAVALIRVRATPLSEGLVLAEIGFADPHGSASDDRIRTVLPAPQHVLDRAMARLRGSRLIFDSPAVEGTDAMAAITDVLLRLAVFVNDWRAHVESVEVAPLALLSDGGVEVREACVTVGDAFVRSLDAQERSPSH